MSVHVRREEARLSEHYPGPSTQQAGDCDQSAEPGERVLMFEENELETDPSKLLEAVKYLEQKERSLRPLRGESEYIVRGAQVPDRRLTFPDQALARRVGAISAKLMGLAGRPKV